MLIRSLLSFSRARLTSEAQIAVIIFRYNDGARWEDTAFQERRPELSRCLWLIDLFAASVIAVDGHVLNIITGSRARHQEQTGKWI